MSIHFPYLVFALLLLWLPRSWLRLGFRLSLRRRRRKIRPQITDPRQSRPMGDNSVRLREEIAKKRNYLDLLRSGVGSWCVTHACFVVAPAAGGASQEAMPMFALQAAIFTVAVVIQTLQWDEGISLFAPIFFLQGLTVGVAGYEAAIFAGVLIWAINSVLPNPATFLFIFAIEIPVFSYFYESFALHDLLAVFLIMIPVVLSWLSGKRLLLGMKRRVFSDHGLRA